MPIDRAAEAALALQRYIRQQISLDQVMQYIDVPGFPHPLIFLRQISLVSHPDYATKIEKKVLQTGCRWNRKIYKDTIFLRLAGRSVGQIKVTEEEIKEHEWRIKTIHIYTDKSRFHPKKICALHCN
jgi:hypothetical protein